MNRLVVSFAVVLLGLLAGCSSPCGPSNCVGCCDAQGACQAATPEHCGQTGALCATCQPFTQCFAGQCVGQGSGGNGSGNGATTSGGATGSTGQSTTTSTTGFTTVGSSGSTTTTGAASTTGSTSTTGASTTSTATGTTGTAGTTGTTGVSCAPSGACTAAAACCSGSCNVNGVCDPPGTATCSQLTLTGPQISATYVVGSPPALNGGGPIPDGVYVLTDLTRYAPSAPDGGFPTSTSRGTERFQGTLLQFVNETNASATLFSASETFTVSGNAINYARTCPSALSGTTQYEISGTQLKLLSGTTLRTFTLQ